MKPSVPARICARSGNQTTPWASVANGTGTSVSTMPTAAVAATPRSRPRTVPVPSTARQAERSGRSTVPTTMNRPTATPSSAEWLPTHSPMASASARR